MARLGRAQPNRPVIVRNTLQDPPVLTTPQPVVVTHRGIRRGVPAVATVFRNPVEQAAEPPAEVAPAAVVVVPRTRRPAGSALVVRASLEDFATPAPIVVVPAGKRALLAPPVVLRAHLEDPIPETTPPPVVVAAPVRRRPVPPVVVRAPNIEITGPTAAPVIVVVVAATKRQLLAPPVVVRAPVEPPPLATEAIPAALVVSRSYRPTVGPPQVLRAPVEEDVCAIVRPFTGSTTRPASGTVVRPDTGVIVQPC